MTGETISIILSVIAIAISVTALYLTHFHNKHSFVAALAKWTTDEDPAVRDSICEIGIFNNGNRDLLVQSVEIGLSEILPNMVYPELETHEVPCTLKAKESKLISLPIPKRFLRTAQAADLLLKLTVFVYTIDGEFRIATKNLVPVIGDISPSSLDWAPFYMRKKRDSDSQEKL